MTYLEIVLGQEMYQERIRKSEKAYRFRSVQPASLISLSGLRKFLGNLLIGSGQRLKAPRRITYVGT